MIGASTSLYMRFTAAAAAAAKLAADSDARVGTQRVCTLGLNRARIVLDVGVAIRRR